MGKKGKKKTTFKLTEHTDLDAVTVFLKKIVHELETEHSVILKSKDQDIEIRPEGPIDFRLKVKEQQKKKRVRQKFILELSWKSAPEPVADEWVLIGEPLTVLPGISFDVIEKLEEKQIENTTQFLKYARKTSSMETLAKELKTDRDTLESWIPFADILRLKDMTPDAAEDLIEIGITSLRQLAKSDSEELHEKMKKKEHSKKLIGKWIAQAQKLQ